MLFVSFENMTQTSSSPSHTNWANPAPAGLTAYALACLCYWAILTGRAPESSLPMFGAWLLGGFVILLVVAFVELRSGYLLGGNMFLVLSGFFMFSGGLSLLLQGWGFASTTEINGYAMVVLLLTLVLWTPAYLKISPKAMGWLVLLLDVGVFFFTLLKLGWISKGFGSSLAGWSLAFSGLLGIYTAAAIELNSAFNAKVLPLGKSILKN